MFETRVPVQMVGTQIRNDRHFSSKSPVSQLMQLKAAEFQHHNVTRANGIQIRQQTATDVSSNPNGAL